MKGGRKEERKEGREGGMSEEKNHIINIYEIWYNKVNIEIYINIKININIKILR